MKWRAHMMTSTRVQNDGAILGYYTIELKLFLPDVEPL